MPLTLTVLARTPGPPATWLQQAGIPTRPIADLPHTPWLPPFTPPLLLDGPSYRREPLLLCRLLDRLARRPGAPVLALVDPADRRTRTLLHHCPTTTLLLPPQPDVHLLATWLQLTGLTPPRQVTPHGPATLGFPGSLPPLPPLPRLPLPLPTLLATLADAPTWQVAAHRLGFTPRHLRRLQRMTATALGCGLRHVRPDRWVDTVLAALADEHAPPPPG
jgi:hypothetical protein